VKTVPETTKTLTSPKFFLMPKFLAGVEPPVSLLPLIGDDK
jgi:hypothetical protein